MTKRFGRNQKRRMREQIAAAEEKTVTAAREMAALNSKLFAARRELDVATDQAFAKFMRDAGRYEYICNRLVDMAAKELGEKLRPQLEAVMIAARQNGYLMRVSYSEDHMRDAPIEIIRIEVPRIQVNHADYILTRA